MEFGQDFFVGLIAGYVLRSILLALIQKGRGILEIQKVERVALRLLKEADLIYKHVNKWSTLVSGSLDGIFIDVRARLLTRFTEEEVDEIMEEWDLSFIEHNKMIWDRTNEECEKWRDLALGTFKLSIESYGLKVEWKNWETAMEYINKEKSNESKK